MKNADMPATPMPASSNGSIWTADDLGSGYAEQFKPAFGLTKREHFAAMAMQGLLSNQGWVGGKARPSMSDTEVNSLIKEVAYSLADKMLEDE